MSLTEIHEELLQAGKPVSTVTLHRYLKACKIRALKPLTKPRRYDDQAGKTIAGWLGLSPIADKQTGRRWILSPAIAPLAQLKATAKVARRAAR